jgi:hypothetical protein
MALYRCLLRDLAGFPLEGSSMISNADAGARQYALGLLRRRPHVQWVDVWRDADFVFRMSRFHLSAD